MRVIGPSLFLSAAAWAASRARGIPLRGRTVVITGGSRGLGLELARLFAAEGCKLAICARNQAELDAAQAELQRRGAEVLAKVCDVSRREDVERFLREAVAQFRSLDVVVNDAGIIQVAPDEALSHQDYQDAMATNYWGVVNVSRAALPYMRKQRGARIVNIASIGGAVAVPHLLPYSASKFAVVGFSTGLAAEVRKDGIKVVTILPGLMRTGSFLQALFKGKQDEEEAWFSFGASLPGMAMSSERAARRIFAACRRGEPFVTVGLPAKALRLFAALLPGVTICAMGVVNALLPDAQGTDRSARAEPGHLHRRHEVRAVTAIAEQAAERNNEYVAPQPA